MIGDRLLLRGTSLELTKTWLVSVGSYSDSFVSRVRMRLSVNLKDGRTKFKFGVRNEAVNNVDILSGLRFEKNIGLTSNAKVQVKSNVRLPEPEVEFFGVGEGRRLVGMGDVEVAVEEVNVCLDY